MKRLAVYTVQTGNKGDFDGFGIQPGDDYDLIVFTDDPELGQPGVETRLMDTRGLDPGRSSRRPKLLPHRYLPDYKWSLYIDSNSRLKQEPSNLLARAETESPSFFSFKHPQRDCIYEEAEIVIDQGYDHEWRVREQMDHYRSLGFPTGQGLIGGTILLRRHNDSGAIQVAEEWFEHVLRFSKRDQLSFNFVAWRRGFDHGHLPGSLRDNPYALWPARPRNRRLTADFNPEIYSWLNPEVEASGLSPQAHFLERRKAGARTSRYKRHVWQLRRLANKYRSGLGDIYYNAHSYADVYESVLQRRRQEPLKVLELGLVRPGVRARADGRYVEAPSLEIWREFLPEAVIWGFDGGDFSHMRSIPGVSIVRGNVESLEDLSHLVNAAGGSFDIIIDSGTNSAGCQQTSLGFLFAHLNPDGLYFIENLHCSSPKGTHDVTTQQVLQFLACGKLVPTAYLSHSQLEHIQESVVSVSFYDSWERNFGEIHPDALAVIQKEDRPTAMREEELVSASRETRSSVKKFGAYALASGWLRSEVEKGPVDKDGAPLPWYTYPAIRFLDERIRSDMNVFEFGSGNSTLWWAGRVQRVTSVEHNPEWSEIVRTRIPENVVYQTIELEAGGKYSQFAASSGNGPFDIIVVDGRDRVNCVLNSLSQLKEDGVLILDNADRRRYRHADGVLRKEGFKRLKFIGIGALSIQEWDTSVFYKDINCLGL